MDRPLKVNSQILISLADLITDSFECERLVAQLDLEPDLVGMVQYQTQTRNPRAIAYEIFRRWERLTGGNLLDLKRALNCGPFSHLVRKCHHEILLHIGKFLVILLYLELFALLD